MSLYFSLYKTETTDSTVEGFYSEMGKSLGLVVVGEKYPPCPCPTVTLTATTTLQINETYVKLIFSKQLARIRKFRIEISETSFSRWRLY